jgi:hypothetical protein
MDTIYEKDPSNQLPGISIKKYTGCAGQQKAYGDNQVASGPKIK